MIRGYNCYYMEHGLELIIARLEILEIGVCNIIQNPGNIGKRTFSIFWTPGNIGNRFFPIFRISWKYWKYDFFSIFWDFYKKGARRNFTHFGVLHAEISHMRPIQARKLKLLKWPFPSCRICSYGPHGPFWFSVKNRPDTVTSYPKQYFGEKWLFEITVKMNLFSGGMFRKAPLC